MKDMYEIGERLLPAVAYGDAAGLPFEKKPPLEPDSLDELKDTTTNPFIGQYPAGTWSDDTHLSIAVAKSLIEADSFDLENQAAWHVQALNHVEGSTDQPDLVPPIVTQGKNTGWGRGTTSSVKAIREGASPQGSGQPNSAGNGVLMKLAPLLYWQQVVHTPSEAADAQILALTRMTHGAPEAAVASLTHRVYMNQLITTDGWPEDQLRQGQKAARYYEWELSAEPVLSDMLGRLVMAMEHNNLGQQTIFDTTPKHGFWAPETLAMAYGSFYLQPEYPQSVYRAVELGGDSDSVGSVVAAMSVFAGRAYYPHDREKLFDYPRLQRISHDLAKAAISASSHVG